MPLDPEVRAKVTGFRLDWLARHGSYKSRRKLFDAYIKSPNGKNIGLSTFNTVVREIEEKGPTEPFPHEEWIPWVNPEESAEDSDFLLRIKAIKEAEQGIGLYTFEADWGRRLRVALEGLHPFGQYRFVLAYAFRDVISHHLRKERITLDLDGFVVYKPWLPGNIAAYELALASGIAPKLRMDPFNQEPEKLGDLIPEPQNFTEEVRHSWAPQATQLLNPWGTFVPGYENEPERADILGQILDFWAGTMATGVSKVEEGASDEGQH